MPSIAEQTGQDIPSVTEGNDALSLFVGREKDIRQFSELLNTTPHDSKILFYYGEGGVGKSLLTRKLRDDFCKSYSQEKWQELRAVQDDKSFVDKLKSTKSDITTACSYVDFEVSEFQDPIHATLEIRRRLSKQGLVFPLYDYAIARYLKVTGKSKEEIKSLIPPENLNFFIELIQFFDEKVTDLSLLEGKYISLLKTAFQWVDKKIKLKKLFDDLRSLHKAGISNVEYILGLEPDFELPTKLPELLAISINNAPLLSKGDVRIVLFFDTYEKLWGTESVEAIHSNKDAWLKQLLIHLDCENGIFPVVAGRTKPLWEDSIPSDYVEFVDISGISRENACDYLSRVSQNQQCSLLSNSSLQNALITYSQISPQDQNVIHPLYLGLCADVVIMAEQAEQEINEDEFHELHQTEEKELKLLKKLLKYVDIHIRAATVVMSAPRSFDIDLYRHLGEVSHFSTTSSSFDVLTGFSFITEVGDNQEKRYQVHGVIRKLLPKLSEQDAETISKIHQALKRYYENSENVIEYIYHLNQLDWNESGKVWTNEFISAMDANHFNVCAELLGLVPEMKIESSAGQAFMTNAQAFYYFRRKEYKDAEETFILAIEKHKASINEEDVEYYNHVYANKASSHIGLGQLYGELYKPEKAEQQQLEALNCIDNELSMTPKNLEVEIKRVSILKGLGRYTKSVAHKNHSIQEIKDDYKIKSESYYSKAAQILERLEKEYSPSDRLSIIKAEILFARGEIEYDINQEPELALPFYSKAHNIFDDLIKTDPQNIGLLRGKAQCLHRLGTAQMEIAESNLEKAQHMPVTTKHFFHLKQVINITNQFSIGQLKLANDILNMASAMSHLDKTIQVQRVKVLLDVGEYFEKIARSKPEIEAAVRIYEEIANTCLDVFKFIPNDIDALFNKAESLRRLGEMSLKYTTVEKALFYFKEALKDVKISYSITKDETFKVHVMQPLENRINELE